MPKAKVHLGNVGLKKAARSSAGAAASQWWGFAEHRDWRTLYRNPMLLSGLVGHLPCPWPYN
jgi:hypothetical protein